MTDYLEPTFERDTNYIDDRITRDSELWPVESDRYRLVVSRACPWASRLTTVRRLLGLEDAISLGVCGPTHDSDSWTFDLDPDGLDPVLAIPRLKDVFENRFPGYPRGITVPALVDVPTRAVATNDFAQMDIDLIGQWTQFHRARAPDLYPETLREEMDPIMRRIYTEVNTASIVAVSPVSSPPTRTRTTGCSPRWTGWRNGSATGDTWSETTSRSRTSACS